MAGQRRAAVRVCRQYAQVRQRRYWQRSTGIARARWRFGQRCTQNSAQHRATRAALAVRPAWRRRVTRWRVPERDL